MSRKSKRGFPQNPVKSREIARNHPLSTSPAVCSMLTSNMNCFSIIAMALAATVLTATAAPRIALVRVKDIYTSMPSTLALQEEIKAERNEILKNQRAEELRKIITELQELHARLSDKNSPPPEAVGRKFARSYEIKRQEAQTLQKEFETFKAEREKEINRKMVARMRASLNQIMETSRMVGREQGYDLILDSSGSTNTGEPFVLYSRKPTDLTDDVTAALQDSENMKTPPTDP